MNPLVSIIIPVYNAENYLKETLESAVNQTYQNIEIICINDGSTDNSSNILNEYKNKIIIQNQANAGQCSASNKGISLAKGEYIKFLDADDIINPEHIERLIKKIGGRTDCLVSCKWGRFYNNDLSSVTFEKESVWQDLSALDWIKMALRQYVAMLPLWLWLIPKKILNKTGGWKEDLSLNNDFEFSVRLLLNTKSVIFEKDAIVYYRHIESSLSKKYNYTAYLSALKTIDYVLDDMLNTPYASEYKTLLANRYQRWIYEMYPMYNDLRLHAKNQIQKLGGATEQIQGGKILKILTKLTGWKTAKLLQFIMEKMGWAYIQKFKRNKYVRRKSNSRNIYK